MNLLDLFIDYKIVDEELISKNKPKRFEDLFMVYSPKFPKQEEKPEEKPVEKSEQSSEGPIEEPETTRMSIEERIDYFKSRKNKKQNSIPKELDITNSRAILSEDNYQEPVEKPTEESTEESDEFDLNGYLGYLEREYGSVDINIEGQKRNLPKWEPIEESSPEQTPASKRSVFTNKILSIQNNNRSNYNKFRKQLETYAKENNLDDEIVDILDGIAALESGYDMSAVNRNSGAAGWFQFLDSTRSDYNKLSREDFLTNPQAQIAAAVSHYRYLQNRFKNISNKHNINLTPLQKMYAAWWNPGSLENYYRTGADDFQTNSDKMNLYKILNKAL